MRQISAENVANEHQQQTTAYQLYCGDHKFVLRRGRDNGAIGTNVRYDIQSCQFRTTNPAA